MAKHEHGEIDGWVTIPVTVEKSMALDLMVDPNSWDCWGWSSNLKQRILLIGIEIPKELG